MWRPALCPRWQVEENARLRETVQAMTKLAIDRDLELELPAGATAVGTGPAA